MDMDHLLENPSPKYCLSKGEKAYIASDNAHGGRTWSGEIERDTQIDGRHHYVFKYLSPEEPGIEMTVRVPVCHVFTDLESLHTARGSDWSVQDAMVRKACSTVKGLVAFLLSRAELQENERRVILDIIEDAEIPDTELYHGEEDTDKEGGGSTCRS